MAKKTKKPSRMTATHFLVPDERWREYEFLFQLPGYTGTLEEQIAAHNAVMQAVTTLAEQFGGYVGGGQIGGPLPGEGANLERPATRYKLREFHRYEMPAPAIRETDVMTLSEAGQRLNKSPSAMTALIDRRKLRTVIDQHEPHPRKRGRLLKKDVAALKREVKRAKNGSGTVCPAPQPSRYSLNALMLQKTIVSNSQRLVGFRVWHDSGANPHQASAGVVFDL